MDPSFRKYFLFLFPYIVVGFLSQGAGTFFGAEEANVSTALSLATFPRLNAFKTLSLVVCVIGLCELAKRSRDKRVVAFSVISCLFFYSFDFLTLFFGYHYSYFTTVLILVYGLLLAVAIFITCLCMLIRINRVKKIVRAAIVSGLVLMMPILIPKISDYPPPATAFFTGEVFLCCWGYIVKVVVPVAILGLYLRYCVAPKAE